MGIATPIPTWREGRRFRALELMQEGWSQREIADALGVTEGAVSQWMKTAQAQGVDGLASHPHPGAPPKLDPAEHHRLLKLLAQGAVAQGFRGEVWTCARVARLIAREFEVHYHKAHVSRLLKALKWTPQVPRQRATQREEGAIGRWREEQWPRLKRGP